MLASVASIFAAGAPIPKTKMEVLHEVIRLMEDAAERSIHLTSLPLEAFHRFYLEELATDMTARGAVYVADNEARTLVHRAARRLLDA